MASSPPPSKRPRKSPIEEVSTDDSPQKNSPLLVFAHGAGAPSTSEWMIRDVASTKFQAYLLHDLRWKQMLSKALRAVDVVTFDYPYISGGKKRAPPKAEKLVDYHSNIVKEAIVKYPGHPLILVGKSMGSRVSCMVAAREDINVSAIICLGYPLKGTKGALRDEILLQLTVPIMFVQGSKDGLCPLDKLATVRKKLTSVNELHVIDGGDHSFKVGKKHLESNGLTQDVAEDQAVEAITEFVTKILSGV